jgi:hypothetical protein
MPGYMFHNAQVLEDIRGGNSSHEMERKDCRTKMTSDYLFIKTNKQTNKLHGL